MTEKPEKSDSTKSESSSEPTSDVSSKLDDYQNALSAMEPTHATFADKERMLLSQPIDIISLKETGSSLTDQTLLSAVLKQNNQEMAQMPTGKVTALTKDNKGKSLMMDAILRGHVLPNANSQFDVFTKLWLLSFYRKVYGSSGALVDFVSKGGYVGPDFTLLPARAIIPFEGKTTVDDGVWVRSCLDRKWLASRDKNIWKNIDKVLESEGDKVADLNGQSEVEIQAGAGSAVIKGKYDFVTLYEPDRWRTFHIASRTEVRDIKNPHKNDQVPVVMCHSYPLLDRFFGLGDFERGKTLYAAQSGLINLFFAALKMGIFAPMKIDATAVENWDDFKDGIGAGQIWLMKKDNFDGVKQMNIDTSGPIGAFQSTANFLKASVLTITNSSDTSVSSAQDPGFGKTPQALKMQAFAQGMQTQFGRRMLELSTEKIFDRMIDLISKKQEKEMNFYMTKNDLSAIAEVAPDVVEMFDVGEMGRLSIKPTHVNNTSYRYEIDEGSTNKKDEAMENETLKDLTAFVIKNVPGAADTLSGDGLVPIGSKVFDLGESMKRITITSAVTGWEKIIRDRPEAQADANNPQENQNDLNVESPDVAAAARATFQARTQPSQDVVPTAPQVPATQVVQPPTQPAQEGSFSDEKIAAAAAELEALLQGGK